ncbi:MAG: hypothetical protein DCE90_14740 [Pseudanabaena sp.]|nr:MAG: hypothetical protein DCE90_14740 [Pseudanabaena sp.]
MQKQRAWSAVGLWWRWVLATLVGAAIGNMFGIAACLAGMYYVSDLVVKVGLCTTGVGSLNCPVSVGIIMGSLAVSIFVGLMQYLVLRKLLKTPAWWILVSSLGWTWVGFAATSLAYTPQFGFTINLDGSFSETNIVARLPSLTANSLWLVFAGVLLGILQCLVIWNGTERKAPKRSLFWWILVNTVLVAFMAIAILAVFRGKGSLYGILWFFIEFTPFYATITAATLAKMKL